MSQKGNSKATVEFLKRWAPDSPWVISAVDPDRQQKMITRSFDASTEAAALAHIESWNGTRNLYFMVNAPRGMLHNKASKEDVGWVTALHVDVDPEPPPEGASAAQGEKHYEEQRAAIRQRISSYQKKPSVVIFSGGGYQAFWLLREPIELEPNTGQKPEPWAAVEALNRKLEKDLGGDHCFNVDRIMRLPGTVNLPDQKKRKKGRIETEASVVYADWDLIYDVGNFVPYEEPKKEAKAKKEAKPRSGKKRKLPEWVGRVIANGPDTEGDRSFGGDRSKAVWAVICALVRYGWSDEEIVAAVTDRGNRISDHVHDQSNPAKYAQRQATRARDKVVEDEDDGRPVIRIKPGAVHETVEAAGDALTAFDDGLYKHGPLIVRPLWDKVKMAGGKSGDALRLHQVTGPHIVERMTAAARWEKYNKREEVWELCNCPPAVADMYLAQGRWDLPFILGIVTTPTLRPDGSVIEREGYDSDTGILYNALGVTFPSIPSNPTKDDAMAALDFLKGPLRLFPFSSDVHRSVALSSILTTLIRRTLPTAPMHAFSAAAAGSGKSLLVDIASIIATGESASVTSSGGERASDGELEKRLGASMLAGDAVVSIDNLETPLSGDLLCQLLTQTSAKIRVLGKSEKVDVPVATSFFATGNNLTVVGDLTRRVLVATLEVPDERPELRRFPFDPVEMVRSDRPLYVQAALTILRAYIMAADKLDVPPLGSFERWSRMVREPLMWLGEADPVGVLEAVRRTDPRLQRLRAMMSAWDKVFGTSPQRVRDVVSAAIATSYENGGESVNPDLREAVGAVAGGDKFISAEKLSWWLRKNAGRYLGGMKFERSDDDMSVPTWCLVGGGNVDLVPRHVNGAAAKIDQEIPFED